MAALNDFDSAVKLSETINYNVITTVTFSSISPDLSSDKYDYAWFAVEAKAGAAIYILPDYFGVKQDGEKILWAPEFPGVFMLS